MKRARKAAPVRIGGVVKAMNLARDRLGAGLAPEEVDGFRQWVASLVSGVEQVCREHRCTPAQLAPPTYRAYCYLKDLDRATLQAVSVQAGAGAWGTPQVQIANLVAACGAIQWSLGRLARQPELDAGAVLDLLGHIRKHTARVERICSEAGADPASLPAPSRRAYQWLKFLGQEGRVQQHLDALGTAVELAPSIAARESAHSRSLARDLGERPLLFEFYHLPGLYRARLQRDGLRIVASEGFIAAPPEVVSALLSSALSGRGSPFLARVRGWANGPEYAAILQELEAAGGNEAGGRGAHHDLDVAFDRLNAAYFEGRLERPRLQWNRTITHRKLGQYLPATDTVTLSLTLDRPDIPEFLVDFVLYHELLHKALGIQQVKGRHYAHTRAFREAERRFDRYTEAVGLLHRLGQKPI